jgi:NhaA family Na+:H+ antiporter
LAPAGSDFVSVEVLGGIVLLGATIAALVWANVAAGTYADVWGYELTVGFGRFAISEDVLHWVNDGLMTVFFFVVGLEIKRELVCGDLRDRRTASLPVLAAVGGMVVPALLYVALNTSGPGIRGWAMPMATDIAFAVVVLALFGARVPKSLKLFLLTLAIVDDIGAIVVIALFYSEGITLNWLAGAFAVVAVILCMQRAGLRHPLLYLLPAVVLWVCTLESGIHATIAGVALGLLTPAGKGQSVIEGLEQRLHPWSSLLVVPIFALANAGLNLEPAAMQRALSSTIAWGVVVGLVIGKPLGIILVSSLAVRFRVSRPLEEVSFRQIMGASCAAGIGFTVSLFIADLSFDGIMLSEAKVGILGASMLSAAAACAWFISTRSHVHDTTPDESREEGLAC